MSNLLKERQLTIFDSQADSLIEAMRKDEGPASAYSEFVSLLVERNHMLQDALAEVSARIRRMNDEANQYRDTPVNGNGKP